ncbi:E3 binding domain-containing protein [Meridianimarinicoccus sp. RP-17]|uniref:E3 binding domain-containing protein n=1 Tax=Meridianimarinicoccus zhengii TaxID=2056810 RepID=UPI000DAB9750
MRARELGVDLGSVGGTGPGSAILIADFEAAAAPGAAEPYRTAAPPHRRDARSHRWTRCATSSPPR